MFIDNIDDGDNVNFYPQQVIIFKHMQSLEHISQETFFSNARWIDIVIVDDNTDKIFTAND